MNKIKNTALALPLAIALLAAPAALAAPADGDLDKFFDGDGRLITDLGGSHGNFGPKAVTDSSGRLVLAGVFGGNMGVGRFNPDGSRDTTFAGDGNVEIDSGATSRRGAGASAVVIQDDGKILIVGNASIAASGDTSDLVLARLNENGTLDNTFDGPSGNGNGLFRLDVNEAGEEARDVLISGTKIVIGGHAGSPLAPFVTRLESNGTVDSDEFATGSDGVLTWTFPGGPELVPHLAGSAGRREDHRRGLAEQRQQRRKRRSDHHQRRARHGDLRKPQRLRPAARSVAVLQPGRPRRAG